MAQLIRGLILESQLIEEALEGGQKQMYLQGITVQADLVNQNRRVYPMGILKRVVESYDKNLIQKNRAYGELDHPNGPNINADRISHRFVKVWNEGTNFYSKALILDTPMGNIIKGITKGGGIVGFSSRGVGSMQESADYSTVCEDFDLVTLADAVINPSAPDAFVDAIMEGKEWVLEGGMYIERKMDAAKKAIKNASSKQLTETKQAQYLKFIQSLNS